MGGNGGKNTASFEKILSCANLIHRILQICFFSAVISPGGRKVQGVYY
jgi:hypothetical protein